MPFKSKKQRKFLFANKPEIAKKFAKDSKRRTKKAKTKSRKKHPTKKRKK